MKQTILLLGETGVLGSEFCKVLQGSSNLKLRTVSRNGSDIKLDLTHFDELKGLLSQLKPTHIINCAADLSSNQGAQSLSSWQLNVELINVLASYCSLSDCRLLHYSTDQYYPVGEHNLHTEVEKIHLNTLYALQKYCSEQVALLSPESLILRTSFLGLSRGPRQNLLDWFVEELQTKNATMIFTDVWTTSLFVNDLVKLSCKLFLDCEAVGLYNLGTEKPYTKADLFLALASHLNVSDPKFNLTSLHKINPVKPRSLGLNCSKARSLLKCDLPNLQQTVTKIVEDLGDQIYERISKHTDK